MNINWDARLERGVNFMNLSAQAVGLGTMIGHLWGGGGVDKRWFVNGNKGLDTNRGRSMSSAFKTIQKGIEIANSMEYRGYNQDIIVAPGEYDEYIYFDCHNQDLLETAGYTHLDWVEIAGRIRLIAAGPVRIKPSGTQTHPSVYIGRPAVEMYGFCVDVRTGGTTVVGTSPYAWSSTPYCRYLPAILIEQNNNEGYGGSLVYGYATWCKVVNCEVRSGFPGGSNVAETTGIAMIGGFNNQIIDCWVHNCTDGINISGSAKGQNIAPVIRDTYMAGNTNDIVESTTQFARIQNCIWADDGATVMLGSSGWGSGADGFIAGGYCNESTLNKFVRAGFDAASVGIVHATGPVGEANLS